MEIPNDNRRCLRLAVLNNGVRYHKDRAFRDKVSKSFSESGNKLSIRACMFIVQGFTIHDKILYFISDRFTYQLSTKIQ